MERTRLPKKELTMAAPTVTTYAHAGQLCLARILVGVGLLLCAGTIGPDFLLAYKLDDDRDLASIVLVGAGTDADLFD